MTRSPLSRRSSLARVRAAARRARPLAARPADVVVTDDGRHRSLDELVRDAGLRVGTFDVR